MEDLQESIQANGVLEPLLVVQDGDGYRLISGHNRLQAVRHLRLCGPDAQRWATVPCRILPPMDKIIGDIGQADVIAGGFFGSKRADGSLEVEIQAILSATNELGFNKIGAYTI